MKIAKFTPTALSLLCLNVLLIGCFGGEEGKIRKQLKQLEETISFRPGDGNMGTLTKMKAMEKLFTEDVKVELKMAGVGSQSVQGLKQVQKLSFAARPQAGTLEASLHDIVIDLSEDSSSATVEATGRAKVEGEPQPLLQDFVFYMKQVDGEWLIYRAKTVNALR